MSGKPVEIELEAIYKHQIKIMHKKLDELIRLEKEEESAGMNFSLNLDLYTRQRELRSYITHYRIALDQLKRYGKNYTGHSIDETWLIGLSAEEKAVFIERFCKKKSFKDISKRLNGINPQKVYETAYKKAIANILPNGR